LDAQVGERDRTLGRELVIDTGEIDGPLLLDLGDVRIETSLDEGVDVALRTLDRRPNTEGVRRDHERGLARDQIVLAPVIAIPACRLRWSPSADPSKPAAKLTPSLNSFS
jgi:hypothetical protein